MIVMAERVDEVPLVCDPVQTFFATAAFAASHATPNGQISRSSRSTIHSGGSADSTLERPKHSPIRGHRVPDELFHVRRPNLNDPEADTPFDVAAAFALVGAADGVARVS